MNRQSAKDAKEMGLELAIKPLGGLGVLAVLLSLPIERQVFPRMSGCS
jgi:hypothetical protein